MREDDPAAEGAEPEQTEKGTVAQPLGGNNPGPEQGGVTASDGIEDPEQPRQGVPDETGEYAEEDKLEKPPA